MSGTPCDMSTIGNVVLGCGLSNYVKGLLYSCSFLGTGEWREHSDEGKRAEGRREELHPSAFPVPKARDGWDLVSK